MFSPLGRVGVTGCLDPLLGGLSTAAAGMWLDLRAGLVLALALGGIRQTLVPGKRRLRRGRGDRVLDLLHVNVVVIERGLHIGGEIARTCDLSGGSSRLRVRASLTNL